MFLKRKRAKLSPSFKLIHEQEDDNRLLITNFKFPISDPDTLEDLEYAVRHDPKTRKKYINFLRRIKAPDEHLSGGDVFRRICADSAIFLHFCFSTTKFDAAGRKRKALKDFAIFGVCMLEAWPDHVDIGAHSLGTTMKQLIKRMNVRNYVRLGRSQKP
ncbi:hypothetical protein pipiens_005954 [Culex pipiens pipiens]|uniref:DUF4806 domain-containing protein n=1 Tax=Culex pipiens pipiens TaxID=38569 RepID=A0ABD1DTB4_CULPP